MARASRFASYDDVDDELDDLDDDFEDEDEDDDEIDGDDPEADELECEDYLGPLTVDDTVEILELAALQGHHGFTRGNRVAIPLRATCVGCGCQDDKPCPGGCLWIAPNLCSRCAHLQEEV